MQMPDDSQSNLIEKKLPNCAQSFVSDSKIIDYLLSETHEIGKHKARYFKNYGFSLNQLEIFRQALIQHSIERDIENVITTDFGTKYELKCQINTPSERSPCIITIWIIENGHQVPKLVTAFPAK